MSKIIRLNPRFIDKAGYNFYRNNGGTHTEKDQHYLFVEARKIIEDTIKLPEPVNFEQVVEEINGDLAALEDYLKNSVFYAAGFVTYCNQELERIRNRFKEMEDNDRQWIGIIRTAVKYERNSKIPYTIAHSRRDFRMRREIALELKEIRESYSQVY